MDDTLKAHLFYSCFSLFLGGLVVLFSYFSLIALSMGLEELSMGNVSYFGMGLLLGGGWGFTAAVIAYFLIVVIKAYLDTRTLKVPDVCPECNEGLHSSDVKWIEEDSAECPHCGVALKVSKGWQ
jgi:hypothetical protein